MSSHRSSARFSGTSLGLRAAPQNCCTLSPWIPGDNSCFFLSKSCRSRCVLHKKKLDPSSEGLKPEAHYQNKQMGFLLSCQIHSFRQLVVVCAGGHKTIHIVLEQVTKPRFPDSQTIIFADSVREFFTECGKAGTHTPNCQQEC